MSSPTVRCPPCGTSGSGDCVAGCCLIYAIIDERERPVYVGRTRRILSARLSSHRSARRAQWLRACNAELAAWLEQHDPAGVVLDQVPDDGDEWETERQWIAKLAYLGLFNIRGNPYKRRGGAESP